MPRLRRLALVIGASLAFGACQPSASSTGPSPSPAAGASAAPASTAPSSSAASPGIGALADTLRDAVDIGDILADLEQLQAIADEHGGARAAGSEGHDASVAFVADELRDAGFEVELQPVELPVFEQLGPSVIDIAGAGAPAFEDVRDFKAMLFSGSGDVTAKVVALGFDPTAEPGDRNGIGCGANDWTSVPAGVIVLVQPGPCRRYDVVVNAQAAGALALVTSYADFPKDGVLRPTLVEPDGIEIPVLGTTHAVGLALAQAAMDGTQVHVETRTSVERRTSMNVIGETPGGDPAHVLMLGGHLDSAVDGPGINDNGSGTMTVLEIARRLGQLTATAGGGPAGQAWKVRVAFFTGEEIGLLGSAAYVAGSQGAELETIEAYINLDMLGSPNGLRAIYHGADTTRPIQSGSISSLFAAELDRAGLTWEATSVGGSSDHFPFDQAGVPIGGLFSGANEHKTAAQAAKFGGTADISNDACFHLACDTIGNIDRVLLEQMARAAAWVAGALASGEVALTPS